MGEEEEVVVKARVWGFINDPRSIEAFHKSPCYGCRYAKYNPWKEDGCDCIGHSYPSVVVRTVCRIGRKKAATKGSKEKKNMTREELKMKLREIQGRLEKATDPKETAALLEEKHRAAQAPCSEDDGGFHPVSIESLLAQHPGPASTEAGAVGVAAPQETFLNTTEIANKYNVSRCRVSDAIKAGALKGVKKSVDGNIIGFVWQVSQVAAEEWIARNPQPKPPSPTIPSSSLMTIRAAGAYAKLSATGLYGPIHKGEILIAGHGRRKGALVTKESVDAWLKKRAEKKHPSPTLKVGAKLSRHSIYRKGQPSKEIRQILKDLREIQIQISRLGGEMAGESAAWSGQAGTNEAALALARISMLVGQEANKLEQAQWEEYEEWVRANEGEKR